MNILELSNTDLDNSDAPLLNAHGNRKVTLLKLGSSELNHAVTYLITELG